MPAWLFLSTFFLSGFVSLSCGGKKTAAVDSVYICVGADKKQQQALWKQQGDEVDERSGMHPVKLLIS